MTIHESDSRPTRPQTPTQVLETDTFCVGCHYNLHGQVITVDERLNLPLCRCPECGKFHAVGTGGGTVAGRRFAMGLLMLWVVFLVASTIATPIMLGAITVATAESFLGGGIEVNEDGKLVEGKVTNGQYTQVIKGTNILATNVHYARLPRKWTDDRLSSLIAVGVISLVCAALAGMNSVTFCWHWPRRRYLACLFLSLVPAAFLFWIYGTQPEYELVRKLSAQVIASHLAIQSIGICIGLIFGRPFARLILRILIPRKALQSLAFLWLVDGKTPPKVSA